MVRTWPARDAFIVRRDEDFLCLFRKAYHPWFRPTAIVIEPGVAGLDKDACQLIASRLSRAFNTCGCDLGARVGLAAASLYLCARFINRTDNATLYSWSELGIAALILIAAGAGVSLAVRLLARKRARKVLAMAARGLASPVSQPARGMRGSTLHPTEIRGWM